MAKALYFPRTEGQELHVPGFAGVSGSFTFECWLMLAVEDDNPYFLLSTEEKGGQYDHRDFRIYVANGYVCAMWLENPLLETMSSTSSVRFPRDAWRHLAVVCDLEAGEARSWIDGRHVQTRPLPLGADGWRTPDIRSFILGQCDSDRFQGFVRNLRLWSGVRTEEELQACAGLVLPDDTPGLVLNAPLDRWDPLVHGVSDDRWQEVPALPVPERRPRSVLRFRGREADAVPLPGLDLNDRSFTVALWVQPQSTVREQLLLGGGVLSGSSGAPEMSYLHLVVRNQKPWLGFYYHDTEGHLKLPRTTWVHLAFVYDRDQKRQAIYINGVLDTEQGDREPLALPSGQQLALGARWPRGDEGPPTLALHQLRIWDRVLEPAELAAEMLVEEPVHAGGLLRHHPMRPDDPLCAAVDAARWDAGIRAPTGAAEGAPSWTLGPDDRAAQDDLPIVERGKSFSVVAWARPESAGEAVALVSRQSKAGGWELRLSADSVAFAFVTDREHSLSAELPTGPTWVCVAATVDGAQLRLWVNGVAVAERQLDGETVRGASVPLAIGAPSSGGPGFVGQLTAAALFERALSESDLRTLVLGPAAAVPLAPALAWRASGSALQPLALAIGPPTAGRVQASGGVAGFGAPAAWDSRELLPLRPVADNSEALVQRIQELEQSVATAGSAAAHDRAVTESARAAAERARGEAEARAAAAEAQLAALEAAEASAAHGQPLGDWLTSVAQQVDRARQQISAGTGLRLGSLSLDLKVLPTGRGTAVRFLDAEELAEVPTDSLARVSVSFDSAPAETTIAQQLVEVPELRGRSRSLARELAERAGLELSVTPMVVDATARARDIGRVIEQTPAPGTRVPPHSTLTLYIGLGG